MFNPLILVILIPVLIATFVVFDKLVRLEYSSYRKSWEADGKPHGFFWMPDESKTTGGWSGGFGSSLARTRCAFGWLLSTPEWMRGDERGWRLVLWWRILTLTWNVGILGAVIIHLLL